MIALIASLADVPAEIAFCFATGNRTMSADAPGQSPPVAVAVSMLSDIYITALFDAVVEATEEAIVNALLGAETMVGRDGVTAHALAGERLAEVLGQYRLATLPGG